ncbi:MULTISPECIES: DUF547 domain-containing protein [Halobacterium]|uniref:DUF547 domain-containing protein n=1 Tax=Halobacterium TaxID=2239 RepID=UPI001E5B4750|nr:MULTISPECIES: DUF547 domain-containing protein [Halobacterium]MDL0121692.1 DUF547 domain-containing protein [Halobacterium salinarum]MDL0125639.1 DUF547 domain-containing protein [Halobacterium salinarum]MDL0128436.1 DUF547 domain-containing protein [Halobacterium salinarum]MDL0130431.1 DUF547 domain-containing protein [Halobacterium salinarum]MDL0133321.1 DUF547 domain-containing protein [Halobacterium salinarum]
MFAPTADTTTAHDLVAAAQRLYHTAHHDTGASALFDSLAALDQSILDTLGDDESAATAFWLNVHGALVERARATGQHARRIAGTRRTAADITHDILRADRWRHGLGYLPDPFPSPFARRYRLDELDERVHFATRIARHAPGLAVTFTAANVDAQLDALTDTYLDHAADYNPDAQVARAPRVCLWYRGDFGGASGIRSLLAAHDVIPADASPRLRYVTPPTLTLPDHDPAPARSDPQ